MNNDLTSVNNYLFEQLERLNDDETLQKKNLTRKLKEQKQSHHYVRRLFLMLI